MDKSDLPFLSATQLGRLIEKREVSPVEATESYIDRIDELDFKFNSYLTVCREEALKAAQEAERAIAQGNYLGPMHGIPVAVKDQFWSKGIRTTGGSRILADFVPDEDATVVAKVKQAGAVVLGKTNLTEFAAQGNRAPAAVGLPQQFSMPRNPWNLDRYTGSSSGGSGAATAAFLCSTSLGEDTGGSIRLPASWCGLVGLKPGWGRVSRYGVMRGVWSMDTVGPMARTVEDAAITLDAIAGHDPKDPYSWDTPVPDFRQALTGDIKGLRIGLIEELTNSEVVEGETRAAVLNATAVLGELGASVEEVSLPFTIHSWMTMVVLLSVEPASTYREWVRERPQDFGRANRISLLAGSIMPAQVYYKAQKVRALIRRQIDEALEKYDVLVLPTTGKPAQRVEGYDQGPVLELSYLLTPLFNLTSAPAITVPCGLTSDGLPIGFQIGGRPGGEEVVLRVAHAYEQNTQWHTMRPPTA